MQKHIIQKKGLRGAHIVRENERLVVASLTLHDHAPHTALRQATRLVYSEMLLSGAGTCSREAFLDALAILGSSINVTTDGNTIHLTLRSLDTTLKATLALITTLLTKPTFSQKELRRVQTHLANAFTLSKEDARLRAHQNFIAALTKETDPRYVFPIDTLVTCITNVTIKDLQALHTEVLASDWLYTCGGTQKNCTTVDTTFTTIKSKYPSKDVTTTSQETVTRSTHTLQLVDIPHKQNIEFSIGNALPLTRTHADFPAFVFGMSVLALYGGFSGRLMSTVREKEGLTYSIYGHIEGITKKDGGYWRIMTFFNPKDATKGITSTLREITTLYKKGITDDELKRFKAILHTRYALTEDSLIKKVREVQGLQEAQMSEEEFEAFKQSIKSMTVTKVNAAIKKYIHPNALVVSGAGPVKGLEKEIKKCLV